MAKKHGPNKDNLEATRRNFMKIARHEFGEKGYYNASTAVIVESSGMARGSLYYHFGDKKGLFHAVYEELMIELQMSVRENVAKTNDIWEAFMTGCLTVIDLITEKEKRRIIVDVHTALTYGERIDILKRTLMQELHLQLKAALEAGYFKGHSADTLGMLIFGIISEGTRNFELSENIPKSRDDLVTAFTLLMKKASA